MKRAIYQVYVGDNSHLYNRCIDSVKAYCLKYDINHILQTTPKLFIKPNPFTSNRSKEAVEKLGYLPIYEKECAFDLLYDGYDQIAVIDSDVFIRSNAPNIFDDFGKDCDFGAVVERDMPITQQYMQKIINYSKMQYSTIQSVDFDYKSESGYEFMNMGVMIFNRSLLKYLDGMRSYEFISQSKFQGFIDGLGAWKWSTDQTLLNTWIRDENMNIKRMNWKWNGLYSVNTELPQCHFVHFFLKDKLPNQGEDVSTLLKMIGE